MKNRKVVIFLIILIMAAVGVRLFMTLAYVPPILMYHSIDENEELTKLSLCPLGFAKQMEFLYANKYNVVSLEDMARRIKEKKKIPFKTVTITFDDGYENNYLCAYPVLKKYNFPATIFIITNNVGKKGYLTWDEIREMRKNNITIGSHTQSHAWLPDLDADTLKEEVFGSKKILEEKTGHKIGVISYPIGAYDERVKAVVKDAGYLAACATNPGPGKRWDDVYALKRVRISRTSKNLLVFFIESSGYYTFVKETRDEQ